VPPEYTVEMIIDGFVYVAGESPAEREGTIRVQRRWVDDQLPEYELVDALREMYRAVASIVRTAHRKSGADPCTIKPFPRSCFTTLIDPELLCMPAGETIPSKLFDLSTGEFSHFEWMTIERNEDLAEVGRQRYGAPPGFTKDPIVHAMERLELSKQFLEADGYAGPMLLLFKGGEGRLLGLSFQDGHPRELKVAATVESVGAWQFDGAVFTSETWLSSGGRGSLLGVPAEDLLPSNDEYFSAAKGGDRDEALIVIGLSADGRSRALTLPFGRTSSGIVYGKLMDDDSGASIPSFLNPIWRRWPSRAS